VKIQQGFAHPMSSGFECRAIRVRKLAHPTWLRRKKENSPKPNQNTNGYMDVNQYSQSLPPYTHS
jgi:hypothetical protein